MRIAVATLLEHVGVAEGVAPDVLDHEKNSMTDGRHPGATQLMPGGWPGVCQILFTLIGP